MARAHRFTPLQIAGGVLTVLGGLVALVQLLDYAKSGKLNLILVSIFGAVAVVGVISILMLKARKKAWIGASLAFLVVAASYGAVALYRSDGTSSPNGPTRGLPTSAERYTSAPDVSGQPLACPPVVGPVVEVSDDFEDGRVDTCKWAVEQTTTSLYQEQPGIRIYEQEGLLIFDVAPPLEKGDDVKIPARPAGRIIQEVSADLKLLNKLETSADGSAGLIANLGNGGPMMFLEGGPYDKSAFYNVSICPSDGATYDKCQHSEPCGSLELQTGVSVKLKIVRTNSGIESYIGGATCGLFSVEQEITSVSLNLYAEKGSAFRMAIDNFFVRYVSA